MMIWHVNNDWAKANEKLLVAFVRAHNKAVRYLSDPANRTEASEMLARASSSSVADALKTWDLCMKVNAYVPNGLVTERAIARVTETLLAAGDIKSAKPPAAYFDQRYVNAVGK
jgi:NitT/TauT family transport system substrate-binding protein